MEPITAKQFNQTARWLLAEPHHATGATDARATATVDVLRPVMGIIHAEIEENLPTFSVFGIGASLKPAPLLPFNQSKRPKDGLLWLATNDGKPVEAGTNAELRAMTGHDPFIARFLPGEVAGVGEMCGPSLGEYVLSKFGVCFFVVVAPNDEDDTAWVVHTSRFQGLVAKVVTPAPAYNPKWSELGEGEVEFMMRDTMVAVDQIDESSLPTRINRLPFYNYTEHDTEADEIIRVKATIGIGLTLENPCRCL